MGNKLKRVRNLLLFSFCFYKIYYEKDVEVNMEYIFIYLLQIVKTLDFLAVVALCTMAVSIIVLGAIGTATQWQFEKYDKQPSSYDITVTTGQNASKIFKKIFTTSLIVVLLTLVIPSQKTLLLLGGVYLGKKAITNIAASKKLEKINNIIDLQLDKYIKELKVEVKQN